MTDAERRNEYQKYKCEPEKMPTWLALQYLVDVGFLANDEAIERAIKDLDRLAAIDEVFARHGMNKESWVTAVRSDNAALCCIEHLAAQDLLPKAEVAADVTSPRSA